MCYPSRTLREGPHNGPGGPMHRSRVNKASSARSFNKKSGRTHPKNMHVMRGGFRL